MHADVGPDVNTAVIEADQAAEQLGEVLLIAAESPKLPFEETREVNLEEVAQLRSQPFNTHTRLVARPGI
jgi:hypothetical protein